MKTLIAMLCTLSVIAASAGSPSKSELDDEVRRLCAIDGGIKVYETVTLPVKFVDRYGSIRIPEKSRAKSTDEYYYEVSETYFLKGNPEMWRSKFSIYRRSDSKVIGESVRYIRRGGDLPSPMHDSSFACPEIGAQPSLESAVFIKGQ